MRKALIVFFLALSAHAADLPSWMAGRWTGTESGVKMEEHWTNGDGGLMLGMHRDVAANGKTAFEFLRIEKRGDSLVYLAMPGGKPATAFPLKSMTSDKIIFENKQHDFPQRIAYWRDGAKLCARVEGTIGGKEESEQWCWSRAR
jgi:hypothetical protein